MAVEGCAAGTPSPFSLERLSAYLDGDLSAAEAQSMRQHLDACPSCAGRAAELRVVARTARALETPEPPATLWPMIEGALDGRLGEGALAREPRGWLTSRWRPFGFGALAGAAAVAAVVVGWGARREGLPAPVVTAADRVAAATPSADPLLAEAEREFASAAAVYERSIEKLRGLLAREEGGWSPEVRARYAERLARLDEAIARSREAARRSPSDSLGNEQLFAAYQQKIAFLTETVHRGSTRGRGAP
jgi:hypothetical protein